MPDCNNCTEKCPQAERVHETALGRMYATQELVALIKKLEAGELVEVVRCKDCVYFKIFSDGYTKCTHRSGMTMVLTDGFCSWGERRTDGNL